MIPPDLRRFGIKHLVWMMVSISMAAAVLQFSKNWGTYTLSVVCGFWIGLTSMWYSDILEPGVRIDDRKLLSQFFNLIGIAFVVASFVGSIAGFLTVIFFLIGAFNG